MFFLDSNFDISLEDVNNNYIDDEPFLDLSDGFYDDVDLIGLDSVTGAGMERSRQDGERRCGEGGRARTTASDTGVHESTLNQAAVGNTSGGGGRVTAGDPGFPGHHAGNAVGISDQPRGGGGGRGTGGDPGLRGNAGPQRYYLERISSL